MPPDAELTARHEEIPAWDDMPDELKPVLARQMEVYAGFLEHTDHHVGRLVDALEDLGVLDDTLVYYIIGDNGASAEGTINGSFNEMFDLQRRRRAGDARVRGVAHRRVRHARRPTTTTRSAGRTRWTRPTSGRSRWPRTGAAPATARSCTGRTASRPGRGAHAVPPRHRRRADRPRGCRAARSRPSSTGSTQRPIEGVSMAYSFDGASEAERHDTQYFEMFCNRGIYHQGWTAVTRHSTPWVMGQPLPPFDDDVWELYDTGRLDPGARPGGRDAGEAGRAAAALARSRPASTTCCRSTTAASSASTPTSPAGRSS